METFIVIKPFNHRGRDVAIGDKVELNPLQATQLLGYGLIEVQPKPETKTPKK